MTPNDRRFPRPHERNRLAPCAVLAIASLQGAPINRAWAVADICVVCEAPAATYRCAPQGGSADGIRAQLKCMSDIAKAGNHQKCTIRRAADGPCEPTTPAGSAAKPGAPAIRSGAPSPKEAAPGPGVAPPVAPNAWVAPDRAEPGTVRPGAAGGSGEAERGGLAKSAGGASKAGAQSPRVQPPPATVEELAERTGQTSKKGLDSAADAVSSAARQTGEAVGGAAKKSWKCVASLFQDC